MNDPDRRQTSDGFDHDAMFADIVAHWSESAAEPDPRRTSPPADGPDHDGPAGMTPGAEAAAQGSAAQGSAARGSDGQGSDGMGSDGMVVDLPPAAHHHQPADRPPVLPEPPGPQVIPAPQAWRAHDVDDVEEHFEPPPIAPLPVGDLQFWGIIAGMCGGPLLLLYLVLFNRDAGSIWMLTAIAMSVGGFALLVLRLPRDHEDDEDNGARL